VQDQFRARSPEMNVLEFERMEPEQDLKAGFDAARFWRIPRMKPPPTVILAGTAKRAKRSPRAVIK